MKIKVYVNWIRRAAQAIRSKAPSFFPRAGVILGSGLSNAVPHLSRAVTIPFSQIPGFPRTTVTGHTGKMILGYLNRLPVAVMQGRFHYYEGHSMESIALPIRALEYLGLKTLVLTSAVGSLRSNMKPGHIVAIKDHINLIGRNPLRAFHEEEFGDMFPDLLNAYDPVLRRIAVAACRKHRIPIHEGVYLAVSGPSYETPAEIRAFQKLGGDVVGMSVVPEVIVARQMGVRAVALSWVANMAAGLPNSTLSHPDVLDMGKKISDRLRVVLENILRQL